VVGSGEVERHRRERPLAAITLPHTIDPPVPFGALLALAIEFQQGMRHQHRLKKITVLSELAAPT
jgi:hypothetical protein